MNCKDIKLIIIIIITSNYLRHKFFANQLIEKFDILRIVNESKRQFLFIKFKEADELIKKHFSLRDTKGSLYFKENQFFNLGEDRILYVPFGESNSERVFKFVTDLNPDWDILFGCSIIIPLLLSHYDINMHLALFPYYRGAGTNFWFLVNREPDCVGVTIHLATLSVVAGPILDQVRLIINSNDTVHDIGCKAIISGVGIMKRRIELFTAGIIEPVLQRPAGELPCFVIDKNGVTKIFHEKDYA